MLAGDKNINVVEKSILVDIKTRLNIYKSLS